MYTAPFGFRLLSSDLPSALDRTARQPAVQRETAHYLASIGNIKSLDEFMGDDRVYRYAMQAFGLEEMTYAKAFMRKALSEGIDRADSFANGLRDPRFREFVEAFNFARHGRATTSFSRAQQGTVDRYVRQTLETEAGRSNEGVRLALYFQRKATGITSPMQLLADRALLKVTQVALGLPAGTAALDIDKQAELITRRLDVADLQDPEKLGRLLERFTALWEIENPTTFSAIVPNVLVGGSPYGIDIDTLGRIQNLRIGR